MIRLTSPDSAPGDQISSDPAGATPSVGGLFILFKSLLKVASMPDAVAVLCVMTA